MISFCDESVPAAESRALQHPGDTYLLQPTALTPQPKREEGRQRRQERGRRGERKDEGRGEGGRGGRERGRREGVGTSGVMGWNAAYRQDSVSVQPGTTTEKDSGAPAASAVLRSFSIRSAIAIIKTGSNGGFASKDPLAGSNSKNDPT